MATLLDDTLVLDHQRVLLAFTAKGCGPCLQILAVLRDLQATSPDGWHVEIVDVDDRPDLRARYNVRSLPTTLVFTDGGLRATVVGVRTRRQLLEAAESA